MATLDVVDPRTYDGAPSAVSHSDSAYDLTITPKVTIGQGAR